MSGLAHFLVSLGFTVSGSDLVANAQTARLEREGVRVMIGHSGANVGDAQKVVVNSAIPQDNPELAEARRRRIPVYGRAELLSLVAGCFAHTAGIAGCHGKTTRCARTFWTIAREAAVRTSAGKISGSAIFISAAKTIL